MKKTAIMLVAFVLSAQVGMLSAGQKAGCACCGGGEMQCGMEQSRGKGPEGRLERMSKDLNLTAEQKEKISAIVKESGEKMKEAMQKARESGKAAREETDKQIKAVLTPEQAQKFEAMQVEREKKMEKKMGSGHHHGDAQ